MEYPVEQGGDGEGDTDERTGSAHVEEGAGGANGRAHEDKGAEGADEVGDGNEKRVGGADMMVAAGEVMTEFVGEKDG